MKEELRVLLISSVLPEPTIGGELVLCRHLVDQPGLELDVYGAPPAEGISLMFSRFEHRLKRSRKLRRILADITCLRNGRWLDRRLPCQPKRDRPAVVATVAHGTGCSAAARYARKHSLPLVTFFHDWWPDMPCVHEPFRKLGEKRFRKLYEVSQAALCVSQGMQEILGSHNNSRVLYPIPAHRDRSETKVTAEVSAKTMRILYSGNLWDYGPMLGRALEAARNELDVRIEVRGANPRWDADLKNYAKSEGLWQDFAPRKDLDRWLAEADAFLVPMVFDPAMRRRMETSFPSKIPEYAQFGKPMVVWGPGYSSATKWAKSSQAALCVTDPSPHALVGELKRLAASPAERAALAAGARRVAESEFDPDFIQRTFRGILNELATTNIVRLDSVPSRVTK